MFFLANLCILCLNNCKNLRTLLTEDNEGIVIKKKLQFCLPEIVDSHLDIPEYICIKCMSKLECFYKFKQRCLQNNKHLKSYVQTLTSIDATYKQFAVSLTDIKNQIQMQVESNHQTLPVIGSDDELRIREAIKNEFKYADVSDNKEVHLLLDEEKEIIVKKECLTSEDNKDDSDYEIYSECVKYESVLTDCDVSISDNEDIHKASTSYNKGSENISSNAKEYTKVHTGIDGTNDEFRTGGNEDNGTCNEGAEAFYNYKSKCVEDTDMIVKEECFTSVDNADDELILYDSDNEAVHEASISSNKRSKNISTNSTENYFTEKNIFKNTKRFRCALCKKDFSRKNYLEYHLKIHTGVKNFECVICKKKFIHKSDLNIHERIHTGVKNFECSICKKKFMCKANLNNHIKIHTGVKNFKCSVCNKKFIQKCNLITHEKIHTGVKNFECSVCNKKFLLKGQLITHEKSHTVVNNFECTICKKKFMCKTNLINHIKIHTGVKNFKCSVCNKKFIQKCNLITHEKIHTGVKNFECLVCNKKFLLKGQLITHEKIHTGVKNFECSVCNKKLLLKSQLITHENSHTVVNNFECTICKKKFMCKANLNNHIKIHTGVKNFKCSVCNKKFLQKSNLITHEKIHTGVKNFECLDIPEYICIKCMSKLECFYKFKQRCLQNNKHLKSYVQTLTSIDATYKQFAVSLTDIKNQIQMQVESNHQTLPVIGSDDELRIREAIKNEFKYADVSDNKEVHLLLDEEKEIIVKKECLTSEDNKDDSDYEIYSECVKYESVLTDCDVSISDNEDIHKVSTSYNKGSENISSNAKEYTKVHTGIDGTNDEFRTGGNEDNGTCNEGAEAFYNYKSKCVEDTDMIVKEECFTSVDNADDELILYDSDNEAVHEASISSNKCSENISTNPTENNFTEKNKFKNTKRFRCALCKKDFSRKKSLEYHLKIHTGVKNFECVICKKKFIHKSDLNIHERIHTGVKNFECSICKKKFMCKANLNNHIKIHTGVKNFKCSVCNKKFIQKCNLITHEKIHTGVKNFECSVCNKKFLLKGQLITHEKSHTVVNNFECTICKKKFMCKTNLINHIKIHTGVKNFKCSVCNKKFIQKCNLITHEKIHTGVKNFEFLVCNKKFLLKGQLITHEKIHTGVKNFECSVCNKKLLLKSQLITHENSHTVVNNFECTICKKKFMCKANLNNHIKIHTGVKNFKCSVCNKKFLQKSNLITHEKIHTGVKNFECLVCNKKFLLKGQLITHELSHTGVKNFECTICKKKFMSKANLNNHKKIHTGVKNFKCSVCNKKFTQKCNLITHEKIHTQARNQEPSIVGSNKVFKVGSK